MNAILIVFAIALAGIANVARASVPVKDVPICIDDICFALRITGDYSVKLADFNSDVKPGLYVTAHPTRRYLSGFLLNAPTPAQVAIARSAAISSIPVILMRDLPSSRARGSPGMLPSHRLERFHANYFQVEYSII